MIKSLELKMFRKHEDLLVTFTTGLNVLRGPNEVGKTTITEGILYALYGAAALVDTLAEVVTWGHKEAELKVKLVIEIGDGCYTFNRSKAGAECNYVDGPPTQTHIGKVTGQKEVTAFAAQLLGADAKTAGVLMLSSQAGLRGALDEGATAVSALMSKLADFEMVDHILQNAASTLSLGSAVPVQAKLAEADAEVLVATESLVDPETLANLGAQIASVEVEVAASTVLQETLSDRVGKADDARNAASLNNGAYEAAVALTLSIRGKANNAGQSLAHAEQAAAKRVAPEALDAARKAVETARDHGYLLGLYQTFLTLGTYPTVAWDSCKASFDVEVLSATQQRDEASRATNANAAEVKALTQSRISGDGVCPTCKRAADNHDHVQQHNARVQAQIDALNALRFDLIAKEKEASDNLALLLQVTASANRRQAIINKVSQSVTLDESVYPCRVSWTGAIPTAEGPNVTQLSRELKSLEEKDHAALQAQGMVTAHQASLASLVAELERQEAVLSHIVPINTAPLQDAYDAAFDAYSQQSARTRELGYALQELKNNKVLIEQATLERAAKLAAAQARVVELVNDIKTLEFNNELVRRLKSMKPMITDFLWNNVLAAVSNYFSTLRGEQSIVTKDASGFKVNGRGGSLSGSTLDMLALAIRVALSKTFVPHASFMVLDEPAHGCDNVRAGTLLGFLAGAGFNQTILASHDELSESVANNVITLGA